ncbi:MAG: hypothetical protein U9P49_05185, partial [Thermodesulfobacteriota bacterium]|nr:hypothetical protein [Thermodesulfobacteriota bacterium]
HRFNVGSFMENVSEKVISLACFVSVSVIRNPDHIVRSKARRGHALTTQARMCQERGQDCPAFGGARPSGPGAGL